MGASSLVQTAKMNPPFRLCPGSGHQCNGDQCCPGISASGNKTFPCPNADATFKGCEGSLPPACPDKKVCPGSGNACAGNQCCPGYSGSNGLTFPCPAATKSYAGCESMGVASSLVQTTKMNPPFRLCPGSGHQCNGDQCCPGSPRAATRRSHARTQMRLSTDARAACLQLALTRRSALAVAMLVRATSVVQVIRGATA